MKPARIVTPWDAIFLVPAMIFALAMAVTALATLPTLPVGSWLLALFAVAGFAAAGIFRLPISRQAGVPLPGLAIAILSASDLMQRPMLMIGLYTMGIYVSYLYLLRRPFISIYASGVASLGAMAYVLIYRAFSDIGLGLLGYLLASGGYLLVVLVVEFSRQRGRWNSDGTVGISSISAVKLLRVWLLLTGISALLHTAKQLLVETHFSNPQAVITVLLIMGCSMVLVLLAVKDNLSNVIRRLESLVEASLALPWEEKGQVEALVRGFAQNAANAEATEIRATPPGYSEIGAPISIAADEEQYLVVRRSPAATAFTDGDQRVVDALAHIGSEVSRVKESVEGLRLRANTDSLTGLPNYGSFQDALKSINDNRGYGEAIAVLFIDLDNFKRLNDRNGHAAGDFALKEVAQRLVNTVRPADVVARVGGDEFVVVLTGLSSLHQAKMVADRIVDNCGARLQFGEATLKPSISVGLAYSAHRETDLSRLVEDADRTMLAAKKSRKQGAAGNGGSVSISAHRSSQVNDSVVRAIENDELTVYFQPIVSIVESRIWAFEALVRYTDPEIGPISPASLIEKAKRLGLLNQLTEQVILKSLHAARQFADIDSRVNCVTVNVEAKQILSSQLGPFLETLPELFPEVSLCLELNERSLSVVSDELRTQADHLRDLGIMIALDDYGSENSSVGALVRMPMDILKIDRSLIDDLGDIRQLEVLRALQGFGDTLDYALVVEGVESPVTALRLQGVGVRSAQGFYYGVPASFEATAKRLLMHGTLAVLPDAVPVEVPLSARNPG
ncbi:MAG: EAL domain-containing protein [Microterricola sp.]